MTNPKLSISPESAAYRLFIEEFDKHLLHAHGCIIQDAFTVPPEQARLFSVAFHTIRGSAGFFGLGEVARLCQELEDHLGEVAKGGALNGPSAAEKVRALIELTKGLPRG
ncbi:MAG: hypothetical protein EBZ48_16210 [Proteobacteria bacterium]|nr:hypothetical protein [Pseudomonadota bacterium]